MKKRNNELKKGVLSKPKGEVKLHDPILFFELYEKAPGSQWKLLRTFSCAVDFEEIFDIQPGFTYRLTSRSASGKIHTLWHRHLEGPSEIKTPTNSFADMDAALDQMIRLGKAIRDLNENIRDAFGWAFPEQQQSINGSRRTPASKSKTSVEVMSQWGKMLEEAFKCSLRMSRAEYERDLANWRKRDITNLM